MTDLKEWEKNVASSKENLWLVATESARFLCTKFRGKYFIKDCKDMFPLVGVIISAEKL